MTFNQHVLINEHFDKIINNIDVITETLLENSEHNSVKRKLEINFDTPKVKCLKSEDLNNKRQRQIEVLKNIEKKNLDMVDKLLPKNDCIKGLMDSFEEQTDPIKKQIIFNDCVLLENQSDNAFSTSLILMPFFLKRIELEFFK